MARQLIIPVCGVQQQLTLLSAVTAFDPLIVPNSPNDSVEHYEPYGHWENGNYQS